MTLKYHQAIFDLLKVKPIIDSNRLADITVIEEAHDIKLPEAIKEYFLVANMLETLFKFNVFLEVSPLYLFGQTDSFDGLDSENLELMKSRKIIPLFKQKKSSRRRSRSRSRRSSWPQEEVGEPEKTDKLSKLKVVG